MQFDQLKRRELITLLGGAVAWPLAVRAQSAPHKIGYLHPATIAPDSALLSILRPKWRELGYVEGETILLRTAAGDVTRLPDLIKELVGLGSGVLIMVGPQAVRAAHATAPTTPVIGIDLETDPIRAGFIQSWAKPGGNVTGMFLDQASLAGKWVELLKEVEPRLARIALAWDPTTVPDQMDAANGAAHALGIDTLVLKVERPQEFETVLARLGSESATGLILLGSPLLVNPPHFFADAALKLKLPSVTFYKPIARAGGLMTYGANQETYFPRAISMADEILKGAKPGDIPVERPTRYELVINLKTAKALGLTIPLIMQMTADDVIE
jgi:putative ABC transport system substrate-binding protein